VSDAPPDAERCEATASSTGERCRRRAAEGEDVCGLHADAPAENGAPEENTNAMTHGAYSERERLREFFDADRRARVDEIADGLTERYESRYGESPPVDLDVSIEVLATQLNIVVELLREASKTGMVRHDVKIAPNGEEYVEEDANFNFGEARRQHAAVLNRLDDLGLAANDDGEDVGKTLVELLSGA